MTITTNNTITMTVMNLIIVVLTTPVIITQVVITTIITTGSTLIMIIINRRPITYTMQKTTGPRGKREITREVVPALQTPKSLIRAEGLHPVHREPIITNHTTTHTTEIHHTHRGGAEEDTPVAAEED